MGTPAGPRVNCLPEVLLSFNTRVYSTLRVPNEKVANGLPGLRKTWSKGLMPICSEDV